MKILISVSTRILQENLNKDFLNKGHLGNISNTGIQIDSETLLVRGILWYVVILIWCIKWDFVSSLFFLKYTPILSSALSPVLKETVYHVLIRLNHEQFLSQYTDLGHSVTLLLTERLMRQVRIMIFHIVTFTKYYIILHRW